MSPHRDPSEAGPEPSHPAHTPQKPLSSGGSQEQRHNTPNDVSAQNFLRQQQQQTFRCAAAQKQIGLQNQQPDVDSAPEASRRDVTACTAGLQTSRAGFRGSALVCKERAHTGTCLVGAGSRHPVGEGVSPSEDAGVTGEEAMFFTHARTKERTDAYTPPADALFSCEGWGCGGCGHQAGTGAALSRLTLQPLCFLRTVLRCSASRTPAEQMTPPPPLSPSLPSPLFLSLSLFSHTNTFLKKVSFLSSS